MRRLLRPLALTASLFATTTVIGSCSADRPVAIRPSLDRIDATANALEPIRVSELHYDNTGGDSGERVEIGGPAGQSLAGWTLVFYNGATASNAVVYRTTALTGTFTAAADCGGRGVIVFSFPADGIQNGPNDGFALINASGQVKEFWSYEGGFTPAAGSPAAGALPTAMGVSQNGSEPVGSSLYRDAAGVWNVTTPLGSNSFGACNDVPGPSTPVASLTVAPVSATLQAGTPLQLIATALDADGAVIPGAPLSWSSSAPASVSVSATGLVTALELPGATITASAASGAHFEVSITVTEPPPLPPTDVFISEINYDPTGADAGEAVEVSGPAGTSYAGWSLVLYNGNGGAQYGTLPLGAATVTSCSGRAVISVLAPGLQNGSPDGIALVNGGTLVEFISYEGTFRASNGPAAGYKSVDIGIDQEGSPVGTSLQKDHIGWYGPNPSSFGGCNAALPPFMSISGRPTLPVGFEDGLFASFNDGRGHTTPATETVTWSSDTPEIATIDADGVVHAVAEGTAVIRATVGSGPGAATGTRNLIAFNATQGTASYANHVEFGTPADGDAGDEVIIARTEFTSSFSRTRGIPNWVSFNLDPTHNGTQDRCDCFTFDPLVGDAWPRYTTADYTGVGGETPYHGYPIDRGHLLRSADRTSGTLDNARTFYFSNIIPQAADNNRGPWSDFEFFVADLARVDNKEVFVIAGASGSKGTVKDEGKITIPEWTWKVAIALPLGQGRANVDSWDDVEVYAVIMPNGPGIFNNAWEMYSTTVNAVEALSGYDLLSLLPDDVESVVEGGLQDEAAAIQQVIVDAHLNQGNANALMSKFEAAAASIDKGNNTAAKNQLGAFLNQVDAFDGKQLSAAQAAALRGIIHALIASL